MTFPTIPTVAAGRILATLNTAGGATKTFPNLGSLTKNPGDLLLAIIVTYDGNSTNAEFSSWGGGFTEFVDQATATTMGIGAAYKWSTGSETGTFTVTTADTSTSDSVLMLVSIPGAHASTIPVGGTIVNATGAAADLAALNPPTWDVEDTLWIAVGGCGETSTSGSFTGVTASPTNYGSDFLSGITADVVGGVEACLGFRQLAAASEDPGGFTVDTSNARNSGLLIAIRPAPDPVTSGEYECSLTNPTTEPDVDTDHSVMVRAWATAGAGSLLVRLMQGTTEIDSWTETLTGSASNYVHDVSEGDVATITDYDDLRVELKAQGITGLTVRVSQLYMNFPEGTVSASEGSVDGAVGWAGSVTGARQSVGSVSGAVGWAGSITGARVSLGGVSGAVGWSGVVVGGNLGVVVGAVGWSGSVSGVRTPKGSISGAVDWVGSVDGETPLDIFSGSVDGAVEWVGSVIGARQSVGSVSGAVGWVGFVIGGNLGIVVGAVGWAGTVSGSRTSSGSISGAVDWDGSVNGETPLDIFAGSIDGAISWVGSITGARQSAGSVSGAVGWTGFVIGGNLGIVIGAVGLGEGSVTGVREAKGTIDGAIVWVGSILGPGTGLVVGFIAGDISGPALKRLLFDGPKLRRAFNGPDISRVASGPSIHTEQLNGPGYTTEELDGPDVSRILVGPGTSRTITGPET